MKRVFIGGMGRSGTTVTLNALYRHGELTAIPVETKFLVEADGFHDLIAGLTSDFSTARTPLVLERFFDLMRNRVTGLLPSVFLDQHALSSNIFRDYETSLDSLAALLDRRNYFDEREPLMQATRAFVATTFDDLALISDKAGWVEKTPANLWRIDFLRALWPDCYFVHLLRDPRLILLSLMEKAWLSRELPVALGYFNDMMRALVQRREGLLGSPRYVEIRLEALESDLAPTLAALAGGLALAPFGEQTVADVAGVIANYAAQKGRQRDPIRFSGDEARLINAILMPWIAALDYPEQFPSAMLRHPDSHAHRR